MKAWHVFYSFYTTYILTEHAQCTASAVQYQLDFGKLGSFSVLFVPVSLHNQTRILLVNRIMHRGGFFGHVPVVSTLQCFFPWSVSLATTWSMNCGVRWYAVGTQRKGPLLKWSFPL